MTFLTVLGRSIQRFVSRKQGLDATLGDIKASLPTLDAKLPDLGSVDLKGALPTAAIAASLPSLSGGKIELPKIEGLDLGKVEAALGDLTAKMPKVELDKLQASLKGIGTPGFQMPDLAQLKADLPSLDVDGLQATLKDIKLPEITADLKASLPSVDVKVGSHSLSVFCGFLLITTVSQTGPGRHTRRHQSFSPDSGRQIA